MLKKNYSLSLVGSGEDDQYRSRCQGRPEFTNVFAERFLGMMNSYWFRGRVIIPPLLKQDQSGASVLLSANFLLDGNWLLGFYLLREYKNTVFIMFEEFKVK